MFKSDFVALSLFLQKKYEDSEWHNSLAYS